MQPTRDVDELIALAYRDDLTGLHNRRYFSEMVTKPLEETTDQNPYSFLLVDIDFFKEINDTYGHRMGDHVLTVVAKLLDDSTAEEETAIRYAGDEFILFFPNSDRDMGLQKAREIVEKVQRKALPLEGRDDFIQLTLSIGAAAFPRDGDSWEKIMEKADQGLYAAKQQGRNRASFPPEEGDEIIRGDDLSSLFPCPEYIGREEPLGEVLKRLEQWKKASSAATSCFLLCTGDRGSGKSRFLQEVGKAIDESSFCVMHLSGSEQLQELPYGALIKGVLDHFRTADSLRECVGSSLQPADEPLLEALFSGTQAAHETLSAESAGRFLVQTLEAIEEKVPLVLVIDDADLLDAQTVALLQTIHHSEDTAISPFALMAAPEDQVSLEAEGRNPEAAEGSPSSATFLEMSLPIVELKPLRGEDVEAMVSTVFPTLHVDPLFHTELLLQTRGNPSHVEECLKYLVQTGRLVYDRSAWRSEGDGLDDLPDTLESLLESRLEYLDPEVRTLVEKASMMGSDIDRELMQKLEQSNEGHLWDILDKARRFGVLRSRSKWEDTDLRFSSRTAKKVSYEQVPEEDRVTWHLKMARLFESLRQKPNLLQLGPLMYHAEMAGLQNELRTIKEKFSLLTSPNQATVLSLPPRKKKRSGPLAQGPIPPEGWPKILSLFHLIRAAVQNLRLYPETSQTVSLACQRLLEGLQEAFELVESIHLSEADGTVLVNGEPPPWKGEERVATEGFYRFLADVSLKDISFHKGLTLPELKAFLSAWNSVLTDSLDPNAQWDDFEDHPDVEHIFVNAKIYVAISDSQLSGDGPIVLSSEPSESPVEDLSKLLGSLESSLLSAKEVVGEQVIDPKEIAGLASFLEQARELLPALRDGLSAAAEQPGPPADILPMETIAETKTVIEPIQPETDRPDFDPQTDRPDFGPQTDSPDFDPQTDRPDFGPQTDRPDFGPQTDSPDFDPLSEGDVRCYIADILSGESQREARGYQRISELGAQANEPLYFFLTQTDDAHAGHICARFLKSSAPDFPNRIQQDIENNIDPSVKLRLLQYAAPTLEDRVWQSVLVAGLQQQEEATVREALHQLETQFPEDASRLLVEVLPACPDHARYEICICLGKLGDSRCLPQLLGYLEKAIAGREGVGDRFSEGVCHALGHFNDPQVIQKLGLLLSSNGILPWRKKHAQPGLRKAALMALERIGGNAVYAVLNRHENDKDPWIRFRVRNFLKGKHLAHRPSRQSARRGPSQAA